MAIILAAVAHSKQFIFEKTPRDFAQIVHQVTLGFTF